MANIITSCRIIASIALLFCPVLSPMFYMLYLAAGFTDMIDGTVARKRDTVSDFGSGLDTIADFIFVIVCMIKFLPVMEIQLWLWIWIAVIAVIKMINIVSGFFVQKKFVTEHTTINKLTGLLLFALPLTLPFANFSYRAMIVCVFATFAAIQEGHNIRNVNNE